MISERLRDNYMPMRGGFGAWHIDPLSLEAAEVIDALVAASRQCIVYPAHPPRIPCGIGIGTPARKGEKLPLLLR